MRVNYPLSQKYIDPGFRVSQFGDKSLSLRCGDKMKTLKSHLIALTVLLVVAGAVYVLGAGNPVAVAIQYAISPISKVS